MAFYRTGVPDPAARPGKSAQRKCPWCSQSLGAMHLHETHIEICFKGCRGVWCDTNDWPDLATVDLTTPLAAADADSPAPLSPAVSRTADGAAMACPRCGTTLQQFGWDVIDVVMDRCSTCRGMWLGHDSVTSLRDMGLFMSPHSDEILEGLKRRGYTPGSVFGTLDNDRRVFRVLLELAHVIGYLGFVF